MAAPRVHFRSPSITTTVCSVSSRETPAGSSSSLPARRNRPRRSRLRNQFALAWQTPQSASYTTRRGSTSEA